MSRSIWPFKTCETPDEFLMALRKALPCRFKVWEPRWYLRDDSTVLGVNLRYSPLPRGRYDYGVGFSDLITEDTWRRDEAKSMAIRRFPGFKHIRPGSGGSETTSFSVELRYLPKIAKAVALARSLKALERKAPDQDGEVRDLRVQVSTVETKLQGRIAEVLAAHRKKHAADYARVAWLIRG